jgi:hypothetical protein
MWLSQYALTFFHLLITHFLKHYLFMCGVIIHALHNEQDIVKWVVYTLFTDNNTFFYYCKAALIAIPFFSGFILKILFLRLLRKSCYFGTFFKFLSLFSVWSTTFYSFAFFIIPFDVNQFSTFSVTSFWNIDIMTLLLFILLFLVVCWIYNKRYNDRFWYYLWQDSIATFYNTPVLENELITSLINIGLYFLFKCMFYLLCASLRFINNDYPRA